MACLVSRIDSGYSPEKYYMTDLLGAPVKGSFYKEELTSIPKPQKKEYFLPEKIRKQEIRDGKVWALVQYLGKKRSWSEKDKIELKMYDGDWKRLNYL